MNTYTPSPTHRTGAGAGTGPVSPTTVAETLLAQAETSLHLLRAFLGREAAQDLLDAMEDQVSALRYLLYADFLDDEDREQVRDQLRQAGRLVLWASDRLAFPGGAA